MSRFFITGDTHNNIDIDKLTIKRFPLQKELTKNDIISVLGDWGAIWYGNKKDDYIIKWWTEKPWTTFVILGNHCNYNAIECFSKVEKFGGITRKINDSIYIAESGEIYTICGKKCLVINGAESTDKEFRKEGISWWPEEQITENDIRKARFNLKRYGNKVDYLLTHTGGVNVCASLGLKPTVSDVRLSQILNDFDYKYHFCGHYHTDKIIDNKTRIFYNDIKEI